MQRPELVEGWYHLRLFTPANETLLDIKVTIDPACQEPGIYHINYAHVLVEIFQKIMVALSKE